VTLFPIMLAGRLNVDACCWHWHMPYPGGLALTRWRRAGNCNTGASLVSGSAPYSHRGGSSSGGGGTDGLNRCLVALLRASYSHLQERH
jgi:hypothetical protein